MRSNVVAGFYVTARHFEPDAISYAADVLNRMLELGRPEYVRIA